MTTHTHNITASHLVFIFFMALKIFYFSPSKNQPFICFGGLFVLVCSPWKLELTKQMWCICLGYVLAVAT